MRWGVGLPDKDGYTTMTTIVVGLADHREPRTMIDAAQGLVPYASILGVLSWWIIHGRIPQNFVLRDVN